MRKKINPAGPNYYRSPVTELIQARTSRRRFRLETIRLIDKSQLSTFIHVPQHCPFGTTPRFSLITASDEDNTALNQLGTYGFIANPAGYIVGAVKPGPRYLEDYAYALEKIVLKATDLGLDSCWVGATFAVNAFSEKIKAAADEMTPAVIALGYATRESGTFERLVRWGVKAHNRLPWEQLFYSGDFTSPLPKSQAGIFAEPLEMVRLGPSASNRQPWRLIKTSKAVWHLYLQRTKFYLSLMKSLQRTDIQRLDMGIAMFHFEETCRHSGITGRWFDEDPAIKGLPERVEYVASFQAE